MQSARNLARWRFDVAEPLAIVLAASVAIAAAARANVPPVRDRLADSIVETRVAPSPAQDDFARMIADMKLHD